MVSAEAQRTLVKSPPELWAELSDADALARHLGAFGEIRIARVEPETKVEWEAEGVSGAIELKQSGWGTKVTLSASREVAVAEPDAVAEPEAIAETNAVAEPDAVAEPEAIAETNAVAEPEPVAEIEPETNAESTPEPEPDAVPEPAQRPRLLARLFRRRRRHSEPEPDPQQQPVEPPQSTEPAAALAPEPAPDVAAPEPAPDVAADEPTPDVAAELAELEASLTADTVAVLTAVLDKLGAAHHRPFSRA